MTELVIPSTPSDGVLLLQLNRPQARNALDLGLRTALAGAVEAAAEDAAVRVVVITGGDAIFAAGADLKAIADASAFAMATGELHRVWGVLAHFPKPLITAVRGPALGAGCELAMHGDLVVAGEGALFGQPEIKVGVTPGAGGVQRLIRLVGRTRAMRMLLTGEAIDGRTAYEWGLASDLAPDREVLDRALAYAAAIAALPGFAAAQIKEVARLGEDLPLEAALALERKSFWLTFGSPDQREGMTAFLEKRKPSFNRDPE